MCYPLLKSFNNPQLMNSVFSCKYNTEELISEVYIKD